MRFTLITTICGLLLAGTLASGWLHGKMANRWGQDDALRQAAGRLRQGLPPQLGPWRLLKAHKPDQRVMDVLQCAALLHGVYTNDQTGDALSIALIAGPSGPVSVHSPEICYSATDYEIAGERAPIKIVDEREQPHLLWQLHANSREPTRPNLRILFGWSDGTAWEATRRPRFAYAGLPLLYKVQVAAPQRDPSSDNSPDPTEEFLSRLLAEIQPRLVTSTRLSSLSHEFAWKEPCHVHRPDVNRSERG